MSVYQNTSVMDGKARFVSIATNGDVTEAIFTSKSTQVPVGQGIKTPMVTDTLTLARPKDVSCPDASCTKVFVGNNVKINVTAVRGDTAAITAMLTEAIRLLNAWRAMNADYGILPPATSTFPD